MAISLQHVEDGIAALEKVQTYLDHILDDRSLGWNGWNEVLATAVVAMLQQSTELRVRLKNAAFDAAVDAAVRAKYGTASDTAVPDNTA